MKKMVLYRVDGGKVWGISMGHIRRSLLVADAFSETCRVIFVMKNYPDGVAYVRAAGYQVETIRVDDDSDGTIIALCEKYAPQRIIFDLYANPYTRLFDYARTKTVESVVFDILGKCVGIPDILINDSFVKDFVSYPHMDGRTKKYLGPAYFIMDKCPEFVPIRSEVRDVMITMGGSDPAGLTTRVLRCLVGEREQRKGLRICVVLGQLFTERDAVRRLAERSESVIIHENPSNFLALLAGQDIVVTSGGRTLYECAYLGRPAVVLPSIDHEEATSSAYATATGSFDAGIWNEEQSPGKIWAAIERYRNDHSLRRSVSDSSRFLVDGGGMRRVLRLFGKKEVL